MRGGVIVLLFFIFINFTYGKTYTPGKTFNIISKEFQTNVLIQSGPALSVDANAVNGAAESYIYFDGTTLSIAADNEKLENGASSSLPVFQLLLTFLAFFMYDGRKSWFFAFVGIFFFL